MKRKIINILFCLGIVMLLLAICIPIIQWMLLLSLYFTEIYGYNILGISIFEWLYWGGFFLILPKMILELKDIPVILKLVIFFGILIIGYIFYSGELKIGCRVEKTPAEINCYNYDHQRSAKHC